MSFITQSTVLVVMKIHRCSQCKYACKSASNLKRHEDTVHAKLRRFSCAICPKTFQQKVHLKKHIMCRHSAIDAASPTAVHNSKVGKAESRKIIFSVHCVCLNVGRKCSMLLGFQTFGCQYCGADFSDRHSHQQHIKLHVLGEFYLGSCCTKSTSCRPVQTPHCCFHRSTALIDHVTCC